MADIEGRLGRFAAGAGPCGLGRGEGGPPGERGGDPPISATTDERGKEKSKVPKARFATPHLSPPCLALLSRTPNHHCCGCCITCFCFFSLLVPCDLSTLHPTEHSIQVFLARFPFDRPLSSSIWCQRRSKYRSQTRRPKQGYRGELRVRAVGADRTM